MAYYCERGCNQGAGYTFKHANGERESICRDCAEENASSIVLTAIKNGVVRSSEGARQLHRDTMERYASQ